MLGSLFFVSRVVFQDFFCASLTDNNAGLAALIKFSKLIDSDFDSSQSREELRVAPSNMPPMAMLQLKVEKKSSNFLNLLFRIFSRFFSSGKVAMKNYEETFPFLPFNSSRLFERCLFISAAEIINTEESTITITAKGDTQPPPLSPFF